VTVYTVALPSSYGDSELPLSSRRQFNSTYEVRFVFFPILMLGSPIPFSSRSMKSIFPKRSFSLKLSDLHCYLPRTQVLDNDGFFSLARRKPSGTMTFLTPTGNSVVALEISLSGRASAPSSLGRHALFAIVSPLPWPRGLSSLGYAPPGLHGLISAYFLWLNSRPAIDRVLPPRLQDAC